MATGIDICVRWERGARGVLACRTASGTDPVLRGAVVCWGDSGLLRQLLGEHHEDATGAAEVSELVDVLMGGHTAKRVVAVPCGGPQGLVDVVDGEGDAVHPDLVGTGGARLDGLGMDVLEELEATLTVWCLEYRDLGVVAVQANSCVCPLAADRVTADEGQAEVGEEGDRFFDVAHGNADVVEFDGHALNLPSQRRAAQMPSGSPSCSDSHSLGYATGRSRDFAGRTTPSRRAQ